MFVWVMRDKGSEWRTALQRAGTEQLRFIPLVEAVCERFLPQQDKAAPVPTAVIDRLAGLIVRLTDHGPCWVDLTNLLQIFSANDVAEMHRRLRTSTGLAAHLVVPVVRTSSPSTLIDAAFTWAHEHGSGL